ncbi:MAG: methionine adenosyltransferase, partial [Gammaproteobacteria bacterium]
VHELESTLNARECVHDHPAFGEDVKVMGIRRHRSGSMTISRAMIGRHLPALEAYAQAVAQVKEIATRTVPRVADLELDVTVNAADAPATGEVYLTVTGTSAEGGDDGETGRGNRPNGLISTYRPMTMEAAAGKNPITHVGKLYGIVSTEVARRAVDEVAEIAAADCALVSQIARPVTEPQLTSVRLRMLDGASVEAVRPAVQAIVRAELDALPAVHERILSGELRVY